MNMIRVGREIPRILFLSPIQRLAVSIHPCQTYFSNESECYDSVEDVALSPEQARGLVDWLAGSSLAPLYPHMSLCMEYRLSVFVSCGE